MSDWQKHWGKAREDWDVLVLVCFCAASLAWQHRAVNTKGPNENPKKPNARPDRFPAKTDQGPDRWEATWSRLRGKQLQYELRLSPGYEHSCVRTVETQLLQFL